MKILAIDTATEACSVALLIDGQLYSEYQLAPQQHTQLLLAIVERLLVTVAIHPKQLDAIAFGSGPGSFTGLRIAASAVQALAFAWDLPVIPVPSLQVLAQGAWRELGIERTLVALDARMQQLYWGVYRLNVEQQCMIPVEEDQIISPTELVFPKEGDWYGIGSGWQSYPDILSSNGHSVLKEVIAERYPHAQDVVQLASLAYQQGRLSNAEHALPVYLRGAASWKKLST